MGSDWVKYGKTSCGEQRWINKVTKKTKTETSKRVSLDVKYLAIKMYLCGLSFRKCSEIVGFSHVTIYNWVIKYGKIVSKNEGLGVKPGLVYEDVEIDEMWHYCLKKSQNNGFSLPLID